MSRVAERTSPAERLRRRQLVEAWNEYLADTRGVEAARYREVEAWAWQRLESRIEAIVERQKVAT